MKRIVKEQIEKLLENGISGKEILITIQVNLLVYMPMSATYLMHSNIPLQPFACSHNTPSHCTILKFHAN
jgi:hypothetical protein